MKNDEDHIIRDLSGTDLPNLVSAEIEAVELWKRLKSDPENHVKSIQGWVVYLFDIDGNILGKVPYSLETWYPYASE